MLGATKVAIMQPYFLPYIGYFQLISNSDFFILYDTQFTKNGWINRNNILAYGRSHQFTLPVKNKSHSLKISERELSPQFDRAKFIKKILHAYSKAPQLYLIRNLIEEIIMFKNNNLYDYISNSIKLICRYLDINAKIINSRSINPYPLKDDCDRVQSKVISLIKGVKGTTYINSIGGLSLYSKDCFERNGIQLFFIKSIPVIYEQNTPNFIANLSIIDVLMFNEKDAIKNHLQSYQLL